MLFGFLKNKIQNGSDFGGVSEMIDGISALFGKSKLVNGNKKIDEIRSDSKTIAEAKQKVYDIIAEGSKRRKRKKAKRDNMFYDSDAD